MKNRTGKPVRKDDFFDRQQEMAELWHLVERDNVLMLAPRRVGKTSVLLQAPFDYTKWQAKLWADRSVAEISHEAMALRSSGSS